MIQFKLRTLLLLVLWISVGMFINIPERITNRGYISSANIVIVNFGRGWPINYIETRTETYALIQLENAQTYDPQLPLKIEKPTTQGNFHLALVIVDAGVWVGILIGILFLQVCYRVIVLGK